MDACLEQGISVIEPADRKVKCELEKIDRKLCLRVSGQYIADGRDVTSAMISAFLYQ